MTANDAQAIVDNPTTARFRLARDAILSFKGRYDQAISEFQWPQFDGNFNWAIDWFDTIAQRNENPALIIVEGGGSTEKYSFEDMLRRSNQLAYWLHSKGLRKGDPVILMLGNQVELWDSMLAIMKLGAVIVPTALGIRGDEIRDRMNRAAARFVICNAADVDKFETARHQLCCVAVGDAPGWLSLRDAFFEPADVEIVHPQTQPHDRSLLYFTSGTTSRPKLVEHTQVSYPVGHLSTLYFLGLEPGDVHLNIASPGWAKHAWSSFFAPWTSESTVMVYNYSRFEPRSLLEQLARHEVTTLCAPPTVWRMLIDAGLPSDRGSVRELFSAGEPLNPEVIETVRKTWGIEIRDGYGQTETTAQIGNPPDAALKPGSMGRPLPGVPVVLVDSVTGQAITGAGEGEICLDLSQDGFNIMTGYVDDVARTADAMRGGFYHTGDFARRDGDGYIFFIGRTDDIFKSSGYKISPFELESVLIEHPGVLEAAVVPSPDSTRSTVPKAYVSLANGYSPTAATARSILLFAFTRLGRHQRIRRVEFLELPKTISGKIQRARLRAREESPNADFADVKNEWALSDFPEIGS